MNIDNERAAFNAWFRSLSSIYHLDIYDALLEGWLARSQSDKAVSVQALEALRGVWTQRVQELTFGDDNGSCSDAMAAGYFNAARELRALIAKETGNG